MLIRYATEQCFKNLYILTRSPFLRERNNFSSLLCIVKISNQLGKTTDWECKTQSYYQLCMHESDSSIKGSIPQLCTRLHYSKNNLLSNAICLVEHRKCIYFLKDVGPLHEQLGHCLQETEKNFKNYLSHVIFLAK